MIYHFYSEYKLQNIWENLYGLNEKCKINTLSIAIHDYILDKHLKIVVKACKTRLWVIKGPVIFVM